MQCCCRACLGFYKENSLARNERTSEIHSGETLIFCCREDNFSFSSWQMPVFPPVQILLWVFMTWWWLIFPAQLVSWSVQKLYGCLLSRKSGWSRAWLLGREWATSSIQNTNTTMSPAELKLCPAVPLLCRLCFNQVLNVCVIGQCAWITVYSFICWTFMMK